MFTRSLRLIALTAGLIAVTVPFATLNAHTAVPTAAPTPATPVTMSATMSATAATPATYPPTLVANQQVKISFYSYNLASAGQGADGTKQLISEFQTANPNITVEGVGVPFAQLLPRIQADTVAGNPPDVAQIIFSDLDFAVTNYTPTPREALVPPAELTQNWVGFSPAGQKLGQLNGKTYAIAYTLSTPIIFYNADLFKAAGLNPDQPPTTWADLKADTLKIAALPGTSGFHTAVLDSGYDWIFQGLVRSNGGHVLSEDRKTLMFDDQAAVGAVAMLRDLVQSGAHPKLTGAEANTAF